MGCLNGHDPKVDLKRGTAQEAAKLLYMQATMGLLSYWAELSLSEFGVGKKVNSTSYQRSRPGTTLQNKVPRKVLGQTE
jgi:hypothetical protein